MSVSEELIMDCFKIQSGESTMLTIIGNIKKAYLKAIKAVNPKSIQFIELIGLAVSEYNYGRHCSAYSLFKTAMSYLDIQVLVRPLESKSFYRLRSKKTSKSEEMFHIPLEERYKVGTQRYSFPGLPCLYLGSSVDVCKEELKDVISDNYSIAQYILNDAIFPQIFDLSFFFSIRYDSMDEITRRKFWDLLPLIALCSVKCAYPKGANIRFRKEYVIPQMLLEYLMDTQPFGGKEIIGIKYRSVGHLYDVLEKDNQYQRWNNYVFPAISNRPSGFSKQLQESFLFVDFVC